MDYNQDFGVNRLHVLDDTNVSCDKNACAIFNGGIYVEKDIHAANIHIRNFKNTYICTTNADISRADISTAIISRANIEFADISMAKINSLDTSMANISRADISRSKIDFADISKANISRADISKANIAELDVKILNISEGIYPTDILTTATLGSCDKKWNGVYATNGNFQVVNTNTCNTKNLKYDNLVTVACVQNIPINFNISTDYILQLDKDLIFINIYNVSMCTEDSLITIKIPESTVFFEHHKIVLNQINKYKICWIIPGLPCNTNFISDHNTQVYEIINIPHVKWKIIKYLQDTNNSEYDSDSNCDSDSESSSEYSSNQEQNCINEEQTKCIRKTYIKYIYKQRDVLNDPILEQIQNSIEDLSGVIIKQDEKINMINSFSKKIDSITNTVGILRQDTTKLEEQFDFIDSEIRVHNNRFDDLEKVKRQSNSTYTNDSIKKLMESVEDLTKIVKKNDKKMEDLETKILNANSKMKKILKYLNLD